MTFEAVVILMVMAANSIIIMNIMYKYTILILKVLARIEERLMDIELEVLDIAIRQVKSRKP